MSTEPAKVDESRSLYDRDPYAWALKQARALRERRAGVLDWENLAEEIEDLAGRHEDSLKSHCRVLVQHLLKLRHASSRIRRDNLRLWMNSVKNARLEITDLLQTKRGLSPKAPELFTKAWYLGRNDMLGQLGLADGAIPEQCPWTLEQVRDESFWPVSGGPNPPHRTRRMNR
jgi:hypothetical protein